MASVRDGKHTPSPELIEMFHRYQCKVCKVWVNYDEGDGKWHHKGGGS